MPLPCCASSSTPFARSPGRPCTWTVVHVATNGLGALPALAAKWEHGTPMLVTEHGVALREHYLHNRNGPYRWPVKALYSAYLRRLCALGFDEAEMIAPGNLYNRRWEAQLGADATRTRTVYNGVDPAWFIALDEPEEPTISWIGRIEPLKDLETLLRAFELVHREMPEARLRLFGWAPFGQEGYLRRCQELAGELGLGDAVTFEGRIEDSRKAYAAGQVVVLSSISEGFPYTLIEAMACGRPCVATDVGGVTEALGGTGLVVPPRRPDDMAQACLTLLKDVDLRRRLGSEARARVLDLFTLDRSLGEYREIYTSLTSGRPRRIDASEHEPDRPPGPRSAGMTTVDEIPGAPPDEDLSRSEVIPSDDVDALCEEFRAVCQSAVEPLEIASTLEFNGWSDHAVEESFGFPDVFALAQEMYRRVPRQPLEPPRPPDPWGQSRFRPLLHGLLYVLPAVFFPAAAGLLTGPGVLAVLIVALLVGWSLSQGLAYLGYTRRNQMGPGQERRILRWGLAVGLVVVVLAMIAHRSARPRPAARSSSSARARRPTCWVPACCWCSAESGGWRLALVPGVVASAVFLGLGRPAYLEHVTWIGLAATPVLALGLAMVFTRRTSPSVGRSWSGTEVLRAVPSAWFGLAAAGLLTFPIAAGVHGHGGVNTAALLAALGISLSMGVAEASLLWYRRRTQRLLHATGDLGGFVIRARARAAGRCCCSTWWPRWH